MNAFKVICIEELGNDVQKPKAVLCFASSYEEAIHYAANLTNLVVFSVQKLQ